MSIPTNLFIDAPEMQDAAMHRLSNDVESWPEEIIQKLKERVPKVSNMNVMVKFMKKDEESGAATGSVVITGPEVSAVVPVITRDFMLYPLDVMISQEKLLPLTPDYFDQVFSKNKVFDKLEEFPSFGGLGRFEDANLWNAIYPPSLGRYAYASAGYPMLDEISDGIDGKGVREKLMQDKKAAAFFYKNGHQELISKLANLQPVNMQEFQQGADNLIRKSVFMLKTDGPHKYSLLSNASNVFHPGLVPMKREDCVKFLSTVSADVEDVINEVDQNGEKVLMAPSHEEDSVLLAKPEDESIEEAREYDHYAVKTKSGVTHVGMVIPKVIDFDQNPVDLKLFISENMSTMQPQIFGVRVRASRYRLDGSMPKCGQTGAFVFQPDESHAVATVPITIKTVLHDGCKLIIKGMDLMGRPLKLKVCPDMTLQRIAAVGGGNYVLPSSMKWLPMEGFQEVTNSPADYAVKIAACRLTSDPVTVIPTGFGQYAMRGVNKYAAASGWDHTNLERYQVKFLLASLGAGEEKIASALLHAHRTGHAELHGLRRPALKSEKIASAKPLALKLKRIADSLKSDLFKAASYMENAQTVDALLSLNFVNPDNVAKFVNKLPHFKSSISHLASCLIGSRLGIQELPEQAISSAIQRMIEVVDGLERLKAGADSGAM